MWFLIATTGSRLPLLQTVTRKVASRTEAFRAEEGRGAAAAPHRQKLTTVSKTTFDCLRLS